MNRALCTRTAPLLLVLCVASCDAARILAFSPFVGSSHNILMTSLFKELAGRGHQMTVYTLNPLKEVPPNYTQIQIDIKKESSDALPNMFYFRNVNPLLEIVFLWRLSRNSTDALLESPNVQRLLRSSGDKFDLFITESFFNDALLGFSRKFDVPFITVTAFSGMENDLESVGNPFSYSYFPCPVLRHSDHMTFYQRLYNTVANLYLKLGHSFYHLPAQESIMRRHFKDVPNLPPLTDIVQNTSLLLLNTHFSHGFPRPNVPNLIEVGGMHVKPPKKLPQDIQKYLDDAKDGVIYFSMGSNLKSSDMSASILEAFLKAFAKLKQRVLWKFEKDLPGIPENIKISKWLPQSDLLGHPNIRVFMTHGGLLSSQEAMYNAVPLVGIPIFADQLLNVRRAVETGYALFLDFDNITEASVHWTLSEVVNNPKYKLTAQRVSKIFHDQPETPMDRAVFWIEYVLRHKGARHLRSAAVDLAWYQYYLLDVIAVLLISAGVFIVFIVWLIKTIARKLLKRPQKTKGSKKRD